MKILQINLIAFGPFTDELLDLDGGLEGFHVIYGPNEAGKSSALRALRQMLYGIAERSADDFVHPYTKMRIGAVLKKGDGAIIEFVRRKGRVNTLRCRSDEAVIAEAELKAFLGGVDEDVFATMFGIDHGDLIRGGREIIRGGGNIGQVLFAAGSGISDLRKVQDELQAEADNLFKPYAQKPRINEAIGMLRKNQKSMREAQLPDQEWAKHDGLLREALEDKSRLQAALQGKKRDHHRLERIKEALPAIGKRKELLSRLQTLSSAVVLAPDFGERRRHLLTSLKIGEKEVAQLLENIEEVDKGIQSLVVPIGLLEHGEIIRQLHQDLGSHLKAYKDRGRLAMRQEALEEEVKAMLQALRPDLAIDQAEQLRLGRAESVKIQELASNHERLAARLEASKEEIRQLNNRLARLEEQLTGLQDVPDAGDLIKALEYAQKEKYLEEKHGTEQREIEQAEEEVRMGLQKQTLWRGAMNEIEGLAVPTLETVDDYEHRLVRAEAGRDKKRLQLDEVKQALLELEGDIEALRLGGEVPTEKALSAARLERDAGWRLVRKAWTGRGEAAQASQDFVQAFPPAENLSEAYELSVKKADDVADRLRREADSVAKKAGLLAARQTRNRKRESLSEQLDEAETVLKEAQESWQAEWAGINVVPRSPREMRIWIQNLKTLGDRVSSIRQRKAKLQEVRKRIESHATNLSGQLQRLGEPPAGEDETLMELMDRAQGVVDRINRIKAEHGRISRELEQGRAALQDAKSRTGGMEQALSTWRSEWAEAVRVLGLDQGAGPGQANALLEDWKALLDKRKEAKSYGGRIAGIDRDAGAFRDRVKDMAERFTPGLLESPVREIVTELYSQLTAGEKVKTRREDLAGQLQKEENRLKKAKSRLVEIHAELDGLREEAGCKTVEELAEAEKKSDKRRALDGELEWIDSELHKLAAGATVEAFIREAQVVDPDTIEPMLGRLAEEIEELEKQKSNLDQKIGEERSELNRMDGSAQAAELAEEAQSLLGRLEADANHYVRVRIASAVLSEAIERYREKHQGPILKRSAELFSRMTLGSFEGLRADFDEKGDAVLVGVRPGGKDFLTVEGMSDGTADQLYLAVRLASLEAYMERNEPMPFIVDDVLIRFDDERAAAALQSLAELSRKTQVVFFTHHRRLLELAQANIDKGILHTHVLGH